MDTWQLQDAKSRFSQMIQQTLHDGPQAITLRNKPVVVVMSIKEYEQLIASKLSLVDLLAQSPFKGLDMEFKRDKSPNRKTTL